MSFAHQSGVGGVSDHGLLSGLLDDDHTQYALADKSRPDPWITAADFAARSLADLGTKDHDLLAGLTDDDHSIYALLAGRSGGQSLKGGLAASEHLTLQSTAHATRGYVRAQDDVQLLSDILRDSAGTNRLQLAAASPHVTLTGAAMITERAAIGGLPPYENYLLLIQPGATPTTNVLAAIYGITSVRVPSGGISGSVWGLNYVAGCAIGGAGTIMPRVGGLSVGINVVSFTGTVTQGWGAYIERPYLATGAYTMGTYYGIEVRPSPMTRMVDGYGVKVGDITLNSGFARLLDVGPATPYLRVRGGSAPAAGLSNMDLNVGGTLYQVRTRTINGYDCLTIN